MLDFIKVEAKEVFFLKSNLLAYIDQFANAFLTYYQ